MSTQADPPGSGDLPETTRREPPAPADQLQPSAADQLRPGSGAPLVEGPPASVGEPISDRRINLLAGVSGLVLLGVAGIVTLLVVVLLVIAITGHVR